MAPLTFSDDTFEAEVAKHSGLVLVDFWAVWCGPCHMVAPIIEELAEEQKDVVKVGKLDVDNNPQTAMKFQVMSIPTVILFKDGQAVETWVGVRPKAQYLEGIEKYREK